MELRELNRLERALVDLVTGDDLSAEKLHAVADAWVQREHAAQLAWLHYHGDDTSMGALLRNVLTIVSRTRDLGADAADHDFMREFCASTWRT